jgi:aromatic-L-amino-acid/L-tryptophan decarboxylase
MRSPHLELVSPVPLDVGCFRFCVPESDVERADALNLGLRIRIQETGIAVPSGTRVRGVYALRCAITNYHSRWEDFEPLAPAGEQIGQEPAAAVPVGGARDRTLHQPADGKEKAV